MENEPEQKGKAGYPQWTFVFISFTVIAVFYLLKEHYAHVVGSLPYLLLLACPLMHLFGHGSHGGHGTHADHGTHREDGRQPDVGRKP